MKPFPILSACLAILLAPATLTAQVYQWKDASGKTVISDTPPPATSRGSRVIATPERSDGSGEPPAAVKALADKNVDFRKRQQDSRDKADKQAKQEAAAAERKDNCLRAQRQLATLEAGERLAVRDSQGEKRYLDDSERQQEIDRTRKLVSDLCQ